jgi:EmrB/QacA subfamily drug resistance transporter
MQLDQTQVDYSKKWTIMAAVAMGIFLATIDGSIVNIALPTLQTDLQTTFGLVQWVVLGYLLTVTILLLSIGRWADMVGKKRIYAAGFILFTLGSLACGLSTSIWMLIAARVFQAIGASMMMALGTAIITENFPPKERGKALGISGLMVSIGIIAGPSLGGVILGKLTWHWIFFVNLPIGVIGTFMVLRFVPNIIPGIHQKFDFLGAGLLLISLSSLLIGLTMGEVAGYGSIQVMVLLGVFLLSLITFLVVEKNSPNPMIDLAIFRSGLFSVNLITGFITFVGVAGTTLLMPFYLENVRGYSPQVIGLMMAVVPVMLGIAAPLSGILSDKFGTRPLTVIGLGILITGYAAISTLQVDTSIAGYMLRYVPIGLGMGMFQSPNNSAIMSSVPRERFGVASGLLSLTRTLGQVTGIATLGAVWSGFILSANHLAGQSVLLAAAADQVNALQGTMRVVMYTVIFAFLLSLTAWWAERKVRNGIVDPRKETIAK